jgi:hypothetical protein
MFEMIGLICCVTRLIVKNPELERTFSSSTCQSGAQGETRTRTSLFTTQDFKSCVSTIPPPGRYFELIGFWLENTSCVYKSFLSIIILHMSSINPFQILSRKRLHDYLKRQGIDLHFARHLPNHPLVTELRELFLKTFFVDQIEEMFFCSAEEAESLVVHGPLNKKMLPLVVAEWNKISKVNKKLIVITKADSAIEESPYIVKDLSKYLPDAQVVEINLDDFARFSDYQRAVRSLC